MNSWIGVDLDGTLAHYEEWVDEMHIGEPVPLMVQRVKDLLNAGYTVKIFTARIANLDAEKYSAISELIQKWTLKHLGKILEVTCVKDQGMMKLFDDRAVQVIQNTGQLVI